MTTDRKAAWVSAPYPQRKPLVTLWKTALGRRWRSDMLPVTGNPRRVACTKTNSCGVALCDSTAFVLTFPSGAAPITQSRLRSWSQMYCRRTVSFNPNSACLMATAFRSSRNGTLNSGVAVLDGVCTSRSRRSRHIARPLRGRAGPSSMSEPHTPRLVTPKRSQATASPQLNSITCSPTGRPMKTHSH